MKFKEAFEEIKMQLKKHEDYEVAGNILEIFKL